MLDNVVAVNTIDHCLARRLLLFAVIVEGETACRPIWSSDMSDKLKDAILAAFGDDEKSEEQGENTAQADTSAQAAAEEQATQPEPAAQSGQAAAPGETQSRPAFGGRLAAAGAKSTLGKGLGAKGKPTVSALSSAARAGAKPAATTPPSATAARSAVITPAPAAAVVVPPARSSNATMLLLILLIMNLITLVVCGGALAKISGLEKRLVGLETTLETARKSADWAAKLHGGVTFLGPDKRPQKYIVTIVDNAGKPEFGPVVMRPLED
jgi:hypothetical protein